MKTSRSVIFILGIVTGMLALAILRVPGREALAQEGKLPFASSVEQRQQTVEELQKLNALMQKQLDLLTSGRVRVVVVQETADAERRKPK